LEKNLSGFGRVIFGTLLTTFAVIFLLKVDLGLLRPTEIMRLQETAIVQEVRDDCVVVKTTGEFEITKEIYAENISDYQVCLQDLIGKEVLIDYSLLFWISELRWRINGVKEKTITILFRDKRSSRNCPTRRYLHLAQIAAF
jgi:hypothetical protein